MNFYDREDAGQKLAEKLSGAKFASPHIFALPRGGVPVAYEVARKLNAPLDVVVVRKLGVPVFPELGFGAIAPEGVLEVDNSIVDRFGLDLEDIESVKNAETTEMIRRIQKYDAWQPKDLAKEVAIIVDDGIATGITTLAAIHFLKKFNPKKLIVAVPVCPVEITERLQKEVDDFICLGEEMYFGAVGEFYQEFPQTTDREVISILKMSKKE